MTAHNRRETVKRFLNLEISREQELQDIVTLAAEICETPIALITLMDEDVQWIRFKVGTDFTQNTRENSFCKYLIGEENVMIVPDTLEDDRFVTHPLVVGDTALRFYAGAPLNTHNGEHLGTLCVFDVKPHEFTERQKNLLQILSKQVMHLLELELSVQLLKEHVYEIEAQKKVIESSQDRLRSFLDSSKACHILIGTNMEVLDFNHAAAVFIKNVYRKDVQSGKIATKYIGKALKDLFSNIFPVVMEGFTRQMEYLVDYGNEGKMWWEITFSPAYDNRDRLMGISINAININERKLHVEKISSQNNLLAQIAHIQSHELRKPVASILGLMNIIKADDYQDSKECLMMMEEATRELDSTIHHIVKYAEASPGFDPQSLTPQPVLVN